MTPSDMLHWIATEHDDPTADAWQEDAGGGQPHYGGDMHFNGINTARGHAAGAIGSLILTDAAYIDRFRATLDRMVRDPQPLSVVLRRRHAPGRDVP